MDIYHSKVGGDVSSTQDQVSPLIGFMRESELWSHAKLAQISVLSHSFVSLSFSFLVDLIRKKSYSACRTYSVQNQKLNGILIVSLINITCTEDCLYSPYVGILLLLVALESPGSLLEM